MDGDNLNEERQTTVINLTGSVMNECGQKQNIYLGFVKTKKDFL